MGILELAVGSDWFWQSDLDASVGSGVSGKLQVGQVWGISRRGQSEVEADFIVLRQGRAQRLPVMPTDIQAVSGRSSKARAEVWCPQTAADVTPLYPGEHS